jgi:acetate kinase
VRVLVLNSGSSTLKYQVVDTALRSPLLVGVVERIGSGAALVDQTRTADGLRVRESTRALDHRDALSVVLDLIADVARGVVGSASEIGAVGHRVVHGGESFTASALVDDSVLEGIRDCISLAPLHNPHNLSGILASRERLPEVPQVAVFDTAFHATLPERAYHYAIPYVLYRRHRIRRYGFHGSSHAHVARRAAELLGGDPSALRMVSLHLGNGASACAIAGGRSLDTSMGFTPLEGLVMGTRSGDLDPAVVLHVMAREELGVGDATALLNKHSGLQGLSGISSDMRDLLEEVDRGTSRALLALDVYCYRVRKYIGAYAAVLGGLDIVAFTGGVGENSALVRARCLEGLDFLGVQLDEELNQALTGGREGAFQRGAVSLLVVAAGEELLIAMEAERLAGAGAGTAPSN